MTKINEILHTVQQKLKAPKNQYNSFGKYKYRSCEDILEAVKPLLPDGVYLICYDKISEHGGRVFVNSTVEISDGNETVASSGCAEIALEQKGMQAAQITGSASSYARKYALNGLFCIDDTKDADTENNTVPKQKATYEPIKNIGLSESEMNLILGNFNDATTKENFEDAKLKASQAKARMSKHQVDLIIKTIERVGNEVGL
jgi:hypothetical protein